MAPNLACRGASRNPHTMRAIWSLPINTRASAFPGLGLKRGLSQDAVIAPYATALAAMVDPHAAARNFSRLAAAGGRGRYGWYEALDYTPARVPEGDKVAIVRSYMAHHQGMTLVAIADALQDGAMRTRFHAEPIIQATQLLLQERIPRDVRLPIRELKRWRRAPTFANRSSHDAASFNLRTSRFPVLTCSPTAGTRS